MWVFLILSLIILFSIDYLIIRHRVILDSILLEDIPFFICDFTFFVLVGHEDIFNTSWLGLGYFSYSIIERVVLRVISLISVIIYIQFDSIYWSTWLIGNLEDQSRLIGWENWLHGVLDLWFTVLDYLDDGFSTRYLQWL